MACWHSRGSAWATVRGQAGRKAGDAERGLWFIRLKHTSVAWAHNRFGIQDAPNAIPLAALRSGGGLNLRWEELLRYLRSAR